MKLYWSECPDAERWYGVESEAEAIEAGRSLGMDFPGAAIWIAPGDPESEDDQKFWDAVADRALWRLEDLADDLIDDGWLDPEEAWPGLRTDRDRILANALREILGPRPEWRTVDTAKARRVEL